MGERIDDELDDRLDDNLGDFLADLDLSSAPIAFVIPRHPFRRFIRYAGQELDANPP